MSFDISTKTMNMKNNFHTSACSSAPYFYSLHIFIVSPFNDELIGSRSTSARLEVKSRRNEKDFAALGFLSENRIEVNSILGSFERRKKKLSAVKVEPGVEWHWGKC